MESAQDKSQDKEIGSEVMASLGEPKEVIADAEEHGESGRNEANDPLYVQKRLKQQKRSHEREMREMQAQLDALRSQVGSQTGNTEMPNPYDDSGNAGGVDEQIHKAVAYALRHKEMEEQKAKQAQAVAHVQKQYHELNRHLDNVSDKYDDFDEAVRGPNTPFTSHMRDAALFLDLDANSPGSAGEVLYNLAKNPEELKRISELHPLEQAREMVKLSKALIKGAESKGTPTQSRPLGQIKNTPVTNSHVVNDKTPVSSIRARMKAGNWK